MNFFSTLFSTDIDRRLVDMIAGPPYSVVSDEPSLFRGMYRVVLCGVRQWTLKPRNEEGEIDEMPSM